MVGSSSYSFDVVRSRPAFDLVEANTIVGWDACSLFMCPIYVST